MELRDAKWEELYKEIHKATEPGPENAIELTLRGNLELLAIAHAKHAARHLEEIEVDSDNPHAAYDDPASREVEIRYLTELANKMVERIADEWRKVESCTCNICRASAAPMN